MAPSAVQDLPPKGKVIRQTPRSLAHVVLWTTPENYKPMTQFYCNLLNAHVVHVDPVLTFMAYSTLTALAQQYFFLKTCEKPILPLWTVNHGPTTSMYFRDPDGNKIELQVDNFDDVNEANDFMAGPKYDMNPMGTDFDPDEWSEYILSKALPNGEEGSSPADVKALKTRKDIGERKELPEGF
ncbi:hypothetical protein PV05_09846 [Exophiala xenobiotica]|uniref:VOC domain-containing protein n=1 Tax=Exophiala xenobiotica TaxID=348802 RepID=A0A0D2ETD5_9EURO|nr:uncharacterized protein PV05_09846 [Exophiala xenobiotica]KIW51094.1 hypothetical protein PV05_09846 [Exophiala xenobiotica]